MGVLTTARRFRHTRLSRAERSFVRDELRQAVGALGRGQVDRAWTCLERAHDRSQNAGLLHSTAHGLRVVAWLARGRPGAAVREVPLFLMATPAAWVRRASGIMPGEPGGTSLLDTWRRRRTPDSLVRRPEARP
ncbi:MAG: DUF3703 domain-containing protein [Alphaproteobacteria bacterium]|nr:DUF3703 domain-containing protein [Alphaproteobacteria bacterium]